MRGTSAGQDKPVAQHRRHIHMRRRRVWPCTSRPRDPAAFARNPATRRPLGAHPGRAPGGSTDQGARLGKWPRTALIRFGGDRRADRRLRDSCQFASRSPSSCSSSRTSPSLHRPPPPSSPSLSAMASVLVPVLYVIIVFGSLFAFSSFYRRRNARSYRRRACLLQ